MAEFLLCKACGDEFFSYLAIEHPGYCCRICSLKTEIERLRTKIYCALRTNPVHAENILKAALQPASGISDQKGNSHE